MKRTIIIIWLLLCASAYAVPMSPSEQITVSTQSIFNCGAYGEPDSVRIIVYRNGAEVFDDWFNSADDQAASLNGMLVFTDQFQDIDGAGGTGHYEVCAGAYDDDSTLYTWYARDVQIGLLDTTNAIIGEARDILDTLQNQDDWIAKEATVQIIDDSLDAWDDDIAEIKPILDTLQNQDDWIAQQATAKPPSR